jgi:hypothetical protein
MSISNVNNRAVVAPAVVPAAEEPAKEVAAETPVAEQAAAVVTEPVAKPADPTVSGAIVAAVEAVIEELPWSKPLGLFADNRMLRFLYLDEVVGWVFRMPNNDWYSNQLTTADKDAPAADEIRPKPRSRKIVPNMAGEITDPAQNLVKVGTLDYNALAALAALLKATKAK